MRTLASKPFAAILFVFLAGCGDDAPVVQQVTNPTSVTTVAANPESVCSAIVGFTIAGATAATVTATSDDMSETLTTPAVTLDATGHGTATVLGLAASTTYSFVATGTAGATASTAAVTFKTGDLPTELTTLKVTVKGVTGDPPKDGYYLVGGTGLDATAVNGKGEIRWYRQFDSFLGETKMQTDGTLTSFVGATQGFPPFVGQFTRYTPDGAHTGTYAANPFDDSEMNATVYTDNHDFEISRDKDGNELFHFIGYELRAVDPMTPTVLDAWHEIVRQDATGKVLFRWKTWDRYTEADAIEPLPGLFDLDHMNALSLDPNDGNYVASMRDLDAVVKIDANSGEVIWQIGGVQSTFTFVNDPLDKYFTQHHAHILENGNLLVFDNGLKHTPPESRAVEYKLDTAAKTATLVWEYRHDPPIFTPIIGSAYRLQSGNTLVGFAEVGTFDEVTPDGKVVWEGQVDVGATVAAGYRMTPLPSLYEYVKP